MPEQRIIIVYHPGNCPYRNAYSMCTETYPNIVCKEPYVFPEECPLVKKEGEK